MHTNLYQNFSHLKVVCQVSYALLLVFLVLHMELFHLFPMLCNARMAPRVTFSYQTHAVVEPIKSTLTAEQCNTVHPDNERFVSIDQSTIHCKTLSRSSLPLEHLIQGVSQLS